MEQTLLKKIDNLFRFRGIPQMLALADGHMADDFGQDLVRLQVSIYALDKYLESTWDVKKSDLKLFWNDINTCLRAFGLKRNEIPRWRKKIERYQAHELELRAGRLPRRRTMQTTYIAKSCDVWLMRKLIFRAFPGLRAYYKLSDWKFYDLITELHDDIEDVFEDMEGFNGNRYLLTVLTDGKREAEQQFGAFLQQIREESQHHFEGATGKHKEFLANWTSRRANQTERLLKRRTGQKKMSTLATSTLARKLGLISQTE